MSKKVYEFKRSKTITFNVSRTQALSIVFPLIEVTSSIFMIESIKDTPSVIKMSETTVVAKRELAKLLRAKLGSKVLVNSLSISSFETILVNGCFVLNVIHYTGVLNENKIEIVNRYTVILQNKQKLLLIDFLIYKKELILKRKLNEDESADIVNSLSEI